MKKECQELVELVEEINERRDWSFPLNMFECRSGELQKQTENSAFPEPSI